MGATAVYSIIDILYWNLLSQWMKFVFYRGWDEYWRNLLLPRFSTTAPQWWLDTWYNSAWWRDNLEDGKPKLNFWVFYREAARDRYSDWVVQAADNVARPLSNAISNLLGSLLHSYTTFSAWIDTLWTRLGTYVPSWATSLSHAAVKLYHWFPTAIVNGWEIWDDIWERIKTAVKDWAKTRFDAAMTWVANNAPWVIDWINFLGNWYYFAGEWINSFKANPYGTVAGWLGVAWATWTGIYGSINDFYNTVWVPFKVDLHGFLDHPWLWIQDRIDEEVEHRLGTLSRWVGRVAEKIITWSWENT